MTYRWDGTAQRAYDPDGAKNDYWKKQWLCGADKPNAGAHGGVPGHGRVLSVNCGHVL